MFLLKILKLEVEGSKENILSFGNFAAAYMEKIPILDPTSQKFYLHS